MYLYRYYADLLLIFMLIIKWIKYLSCNIYTDDKMNAYLNRVYVLNMYYMLDMSLLLQNGSQYILINYKVLSNKGGYESLSGCVD